MDAANDLALLKADGHFAPLPIAASRTGLLGGTVATVGFPDIGLQGLFQLKSPHPGPLPVWRGEGEATAPVRDLFERNHRAQVPS
jgi:hypothetical protein